MIVYLVEALPVAKVGGAQVVLRYASAPQRFRPNGFDWQVRLAVPFRRAFQAFDGTFSDQPASFGSFEVRMSTGDLVSPVSGLAWDGRRVRIWRGAPGLDTAQMELVFDGEAQSVSATKQGFQVELRGPGYPLTKNALSLYAGSGAAEGSGDLAATPKPLILGKVTNASPVYLDRAKGIFQYHAYGAGSLQGVYDGGSALAFTGTNYATYAQLDAAAVPGGQYSTCDAIGAAKHGGQPISVLTVDATATATSSGTIAAILTWVAGQAGVTVDAPTMAWFDANLAHPQDNYVTDQTTWEAIVKDMLLKLGGYLWWTPDGRMSAGLVRRGAAPSVQLGRTNLADVKVNPTQPPYFRRRMGYQRSWRVQSYAETRTPREVTPRGTYAAGSAYAYYDLVNFGIDTWLHIGENPTTGVEPAEGAVWTKFGVGATKTSQLTDDAGLGLTATWPQVGGLGRPVDYADVTAANTASAITNQGAFATKSSVGYGSTFLTGFGSLSPMNSLFFGSSALTETNGGASATLNAFKTALGIASGFTGQGLLATLSSLANGSTYLTGFGALSPLDALFFGSSALTETNGGAAASLANFKTALGIASGFSGQGSLATLSSLANGGAYLTGFGGLSSLSNVFFGSPQLLEASAGAQATLANFKTSSGTAAGISGQGAFATLSSAAYGSNLLTGFGALAPLGTITFGGSYLLESAGTPATNANYKTSSGTAAGIAGQGSLATLSSLANGSGFLTGFGGLSSLSAINFGSANLLEASGGAQATLANFKTSSGTAAGIAGQGSLATLSSLANGGAYLTGFGGLSSLTSINFGSANLLEASGGAQATLANFKTSSGTAAAIAGQGSLATASTIGTDSQLSGTILNRLAPYSGDPNYLLASRVAWGLGNTVEALKPGEAGANVTEGRTAAAISGQGPWATTPTAVGTVTTPKPNAMPYPRPLSNGRLPSDYGWNLYVASGSGPALGVWGGEPSVTGGPAYVAARPTGGALQNVIYFYDIPWLEGRSAAVSVAGYGNAFQLGGEFINTAKTATLASSYTGTQVNGRFGVTLGAAPAGTGFLRVLIVSTFLAQSTYQDVVWWAIKAEEGGVVTPYSEEGNRVLGADRMSYSTGNTGEQLRPGEFGANVTESRTASAITSQGAFATLSSAAYGSSYLTGFSSLAARSDVYFGSSFIKETSGGTQATLAAFKTSSGVAASISGQGTFATQSTISSDTQFSGVMSNRFAPYAGDANFLRANRIAWQGGDVVENWKPQEGGANITENRTAAAITAQGWGATASAAQAQNTQVGLGSNQVVNSRFTRGLYAWSTPSSDQGSAPAIGVVSGFNNPSYSGVRDVAYMQVNTAAAWNGYCDMAPRGAWTGEHGAYTKKFYTPVKQGDRLFASALLAPHRCNALIYVLQFDQAGTLLTADSLQGGTANGGANGIPTNFTRVGRFSDVTNANAVWACIMIRAQGNGGTSPYLFYTETMLSKVAAGQTTWPEYSDGPADTLADQTGSNTAAAISGQGSLATASTISADSQLSGTIANRLQGSPADTNYLNPNRMAWATGGTVEGWKPGEPLANKTETRTAAAISGQADWATYTGQSTGTVANKTQFLQTDGAMQAAYIYKPNKGNMNDFFPEDVNSNRTESRTAAAITSQGPWATSARPVASVTTPAANIFPYPRPLSNGRAPIDYGWNLYSPQGNPPSLQAYLGEPAKFGGAAYVANRPSGGGVQQALYFFDVPWQPNVPAVASAFGYSNAFSLTIEAQPAARNGALAFGSSQQADGRWFSVISNPPAGTVWMRVILSTTWPAFGGYQDIVFWGIKLENGATTTPYSEDAARVVGSDKMLYQDGNSASALKPAEGGANVTEGRTAAAISGQSAWATYGGLSTTTVENRTQRLQGDGYIEAGTIYKASSGFLTDRWAAEGGANITENRTSAGISGQGSFATLSQVNRFNVASYFNYNAFSLNYSVTRADGTSVVTESLAITSQGVSAGFSGQGSLATMSSVGTDQINANSVTVPGYYTVDNGGGLGSYPINTWADFNTDTGGGSVGGGGGGGSGGGGWTPQMPQQ